MALQLVHLYFIKQTSVGMVTHFLTRHLGHVISDFKGF